jgi:hypothetical protein
VFICGFILGVFGCHAPPKPPPGSYFGPTESIGAVVRGVNARVHELATLRAAGDFEATIVDRNKSSFVNGEITLLYARPDKLRMVGKKDIAGRIFEIGTNGQRYWLIVRGDTDTMWFGNYANLDKMGTPRGQIPIRPDLLLEVLGVSDINPNLIAEPYPVMRYNNDYDAYMMTWHVKLPDRLVAQKEVWYDRQTLLPTQVLLFDANGRVVLSAKLMRHQPVEVPDVPREQWPKVASSCRLFFPDSGTRMSFNFSDLALQKNGAPRDTSFNFPGDTAGVSHVVNVDEQPPRE